MSEGGGFCDKHGPFDPPHTSCPFCAIEREERQAFGPPEATRPAAAQTINDIEAAAPPDAPDAGVPAEADADADNAGDDRDFVRQTVEPESDGSVTEVAPRPDVPPEALEHGPDADDPGGPVGWLVVKEPVEQRGTALTVRANQIIGRAGDVRWPDPRLSRQHARLTFEPPEDDPDSAAVFHLWPFGPTNPVYVNGAAIRGATPVHENDEITLGNTLFVFKVLLD